MHKYSFGEQGRPFANPAPALATRPSWGYYTAKSNPAQSLRDPDHAFGVPPAVFFKLLTNPPPFLSRHIPECYPQELIGGSSAFLNFQPFVTLTGQRR